MNVPDDQFVVPELELGVYEHYKGNRYEVLGVGLHSETNEPVVVYKPLHTSKVPYWVRPYAMFLETVSVDGKEVPRFRKLGENE